MTRIGFVKLLTLIAIPLAGYPLAGAPPAGAQAQSGVYSAPPTVQLSDVQNAIATQAAADAQVYAVQSSVPGPCNQVPSPDTQTGSLGTGSCYQRSTDTRPTQVQTPSAPVTTASDGTFSGSWKASFSSAPTTTWAQANTTSAPYVCQAVGTATGFSGRCWQINNPTLTSVTIAGISAAIGGQVVGVTSSVAGIAVSVGARQ